MKRISYSGEMLVTGDDIAGALVAYAAELARADSSDSVTIPTRNDSGEITSTTLLIGPASQIVVSEESQNGDELIDDGVVADLDTRRRHVGPRQGAASDFDDEASVDDFPDFA